MRALLSSIALLLLVCFLPVHALAAPPADTVDVALPEVVVEATRETQTSADAPFAVSVQLVPQETIQFQPRLSLNDALDKLPGLQIDNRGHFAVGERVSVRGIGRRAPFGTRGVQVVLDGVPLTMPDGQAVLEAVEPSLIRKAELLRGPASLFWGNATGGVLFLTTMPDDAEFTPLRARILAGSYGERHLVAEGQARPGNLRLHAFSSHVEQNGYREYSAGRRTRAGLNGLLPLGPRTSLRFTGAVVDQNTEHPGSLNREQVEENPRQARPLFVDDQAGKWSTQAQLGFGLDHEMQIGTLSATTFGILRSLDNPLPFAYIDLNRRAGGVRLALQNETGRLHWSLGADASAQGDDRKNWNTVDGQAGDELELDQFETVYDAAAFGAVRARLTDQLALNLGLRADGVVFSVDDRLPDQGDDQSGERSFLAWSPAAGLSYETGPAQWYANYRTAFETPTTTELVNRPDMTGGFNQNLDPQIVRGLEIGSRGTVPGIPLQFDVAAFRLFVENRIVSFRTEEGGDRDFFRNAGLTTHDGIELSARWQLHPDVALQANYTGGRYQYRDEELEGNQVPGVPPHRLHANLTVNPGGFWGRLSTELASAMYVDDANSEQSSGYTLLHLEAGYRGLPFAGVYIAPFASVQNLFDTTYMGSVTVNDSFGRYYEPAAGRTFSAGLNVSL